MSNELKLYSYLVKVAQQRVEAAIVSQDAQSCRDEVRRMVALVNRLKHYAEEQK